MIVAVLIVGFVGLLLIGFGYAIGKKKIITLLHDYHYDNVSEDDKPIFCTYMGLGVGIIGAALCTTAVLLAVTDSAGSFIALGAGFVAGPIPLIYAGKYNR